MICGLDALHFSMFLCIHWLDITFMIISDKYTQELRTHGAEHSNFILDPYCLLQSAGNLGKNLFSL